MTEETAISKEEFDRQVQDSDLPVLADFWAPWCGSCRLLAPSVKRLSANKADKLRVVMVNVETSPDVAEAYGVMSLPTLLLFNNGKEAKRLNGSRSYDVLEGEVMQVIG